MGDDAKKTILARRARFLAAAVAGLAVEACGKTEATRDAGAEIAPQPCLSAPPQPCLSVPITTPQPCLKPPATERTNADGGTKKDCNPPYTIDANGQKHYKPDCL